MLQTRWAWWALKPTKPIEKKVVFLKISSNLMLIFVLVGQPQPSPWDDWLSNWLTDRPTDRMNVWINCPQTEPQINRFEVCTKDFKKTSMTQLDFGWWPHGYWMGCFHRLSSTIPANELQTPSGHLENSKNYRPDDGRKMITMKDTQCCWYW